MVNQPSKNLTTNITKLVNQPYKYGFSTNIEKDRIQKGLNEETIVLISKKKTWIAILSLKNISSCKFIKMKED